METNTSLEQDARAACAECGSSFAVEDMIRHGAAYVCAKCKPVFLQKLAEGADISSGLRYAGFWLRAGASILDGVILVLAALGLQMILLGASVGQLNNGSTPTVLLFIRQAISFMGAVAYETVFIGRFGATLGKMALKVHVVTADGRRVSYLRAFGRYFGKLLSTFTLGIGYLLAAFDPQARALHDRVCNTRVVRN
jgi:uncharacterized RDD family membrane protein YckC